jgi:hypothetical protein
LSFELKTTILNIHEFISDHKETVPGIACMDRVIKWLMEGDPAIRWQVMRDLLDMPESIWQAERRRTLREGWGARLLGKQDAHGVWGGGLYSPKWISSTYTLLTLAGIGLPPDCFPARRGAQIALDGLFGLEADNDLYRRTNNYDQCVSGMFVQLAAYFGIALERVNVMVKSLLEHRMPDGGWNCRIKRKPLPSHSSFHTTINVLEGLREAVEQGVCVHAKSVLAAEAEARELLLRHGLFRSHRTGEIIDRRWMLLSHPPRWHFDILRALDYFARVDAKRDLRLKESVDLLISRRRPDGRWPVQNKHRALVYFNMEKTGSPSRWNTLRALRVLRWWHRGSEVSEKSK